MRLFRRTYGRTVFGALLWAALLAASGARAADSPPGIAGREITDGAGRIVRADKPFTRIISLYPAHTENLFALGLDKEIVGVSALDDYPPQAEARPRFSYRDDPERFLAAWPDLVLVRPMVDRAYPQLLAILEQRGIAVVSLQPSGVEELSGYWRILGALTGKEKEAQALADDFFGQVEAWRRWSRGIRPKKRVYFEAVHSKTKTFSPGAMAIFALTAAGGLNAAADAVPSRGTNIAVFGKERLLSRAGAIDVYLAQSGAMNQVSRETILEEPGFSLIKAVQEGEVYILDEALVSRPTPRLLQGIWRIAEILYPGRVPADPAVGLQGSAP
ncbi:MAG: ABC transporter substrate-binding protein [Thermodesulfobacteriota bacterium]